MNPDLLPRLRAFTASFHRCFGVSAGETATLVEALRELETIQAEFEKLSDPVAVHLNMLHGAIAKPTWTSIAHLYPEAEALKARAAALERALHIVRRGLCAGAVKSASLIVHGESDAEMKVVSLRQIVEGALDVGGAHG